MGGRIESGLRLSRVIATPGGGGGEGGEEGGRGGGGVRVTTAYYI